MCFTEVTQGIPPSEAAPPAGVELWGEQWLRLPLGSQRVGELCGSQQDHTRGDLLL